MRIVLENNVFYISFVSTVLIVLLLLIRGILGTKIHKMFFTIAWTFILARLIVPLNLIVSVRWPYCVKNLCKSFATISFARFLWIWCAGACVTAAVFVVRYVMCGRMLREALPIQKVPGIDEEMFTFMGIRVYVSDRISSPITFGILHQKVLLPKYYMNLSREQLKYILIHEKVHIDCHDNLNKFLVIVAVCIHWFNPFAWLMYVCYNQDLELACDEKVIRQVGEVGREAYANVLISLASKDIIGEPVYSGFAGNAIRKRIIMIMGYRHTRKWNYGLYAVASVLFIATFAVPGQIEALSGMSSAGAVSGGAISPGAAASAEPDKKEYKAVKVHRILKDDSSGARTYVTVKTVEGVELNIKILLNKKIAVTTGSVLTSYLPEGESWGAGMDTAYDGVVTIPEAVAFEGGQYPVQKIGSYTFYECKKVRKIRIPDTVKEIEAKSFYECEALKKLRLPPGLEVMGVNPFVGCSSLEEFEMPESHMQYQVKDGVLYTDYGRYLKVFPQGSKQKDVVVDSDVVQIANCAFYGAGVQSVTLPDGLARVKSKSFQNCRQLLRVRASRKTRFVSDAFQGAGQAQIIRYESQ